MMKRVMRGYRESTALLLILFLYAPAQLIFASRSDDRKARITAYENGSNYMPPLSTGASSSMTNPLAASNGRTTFNCGGEGEKPCAINTDFFWENGNLFCDRGLKATGFKIIGNSIYFNSSDWLNLNEAKLTEVKRVFDNDLPALKTRLESLSEDDFISWKCAGKMVDGKCYLVPPICGPLGCTDGVPSELVPIPDFDKSGWDIPEDLKDFVEKVDKAIRAANLPGAIKDIPGEKPDINFDFTLSNFSLSSFRSQLRALKTFFSADNPFIQNIKALISDFYNPPGQCINRTRRQPAARTFQQTPQYWALMNQYELSKDEPYNWSQRIGAHNAFNNAADGYVAPNQKYSMTDQLNMGARVLYLDIHWYNDQLRLCHGQKNQAGCSNTDRYYANGIKEIGNWLRENPREVITIVLEDYSEEDGQIRDAYVNDPIAAYLVNRAGISLVYSPEVGRARGFDLSNAGAIMPSLEKIREVSKQVIIFSENTQRGRWIWSRKSNSNIFATTRASTFFFTNQDYEFSDGVPPPYIGGAYRCVSYAGTDPEKAQFDFTRFAPQNSIGFFTNIYEARSLIDPFEFSGLLDEAKVSQLTKCQVTEIGLDLIQAKNETSDIVCNVDPMLRPTCKTADTRLQAAIWSWRTGDRGDRGDAAIMSRADGRWSSRDPQELHHFACSKPREGEPEDWPDQEGVNWKVTEARGKWFDGDRQCRLEFGDEYTFSVPRSGFQNELLKRTDSPAFAPTMWLNYNDIRTEGRWVINNRPSINPGPDRTVNEGQRVSFNALNSSDPDFFGDVDGDNVSFRWEFGDGSQAASGITPQHVFPDDGQYRVTLTAQDQFGATVSRSLFVTVNNVNPTLVAGGDQTISLSGQASLQASFTDPGFDCPTCESGSIESFSSTIDWGDGQTEAGLITLTQGNAGKPTTGSITGNHTYTAEGVYTAQVCLTDDNQGSDCKTFKVTVLDTVIPNIDGINTASSINGIATASWGNPAGPGTPNSVAARAEGDGTVTVAGLTKNPISSKGFASSAAFSYVKLESGHSFREVTITNCRLNGGSLAYWWDGKEWMVASDQQYDRQKGCITMMVNGSTVPSLGDLTKGAYFGIKNTEDQILELISLVEDFNLKKSSARKFDHALSKALEASKRGDAATLCKELDWFIRKVNQESRKKITSEESARLLTRANRTASLLPCH